MDTNRITPEMEARLGERMLAFAIAGGHVAKLPPDTEAVRVRRVGTLKRRCVDLLRECEATYADVSAVFGISASHASNLLSTLNTDGDLRLVRKTVLTSGRAASVYTHAEAP